MVPDRLRVANQIMAGSTHQLVHSLSCLNYMLGKTHPLSLVRHDRREVINDNVLTIRLTSVLGAHMLADPKGLVFLPWAYA